MRGIIDFHTHAFPDELAGRAMRMLEEEGGIKAHLDGKIASLLSSMDRVGIEKSIVCSIATKPAQFDSILEWSKQVETERILPFPSFHPCDPEFRERVERIKQSGLKGIKFHPYYQQFDIDDDSLLPVYESIAEANLLLVVHTGFDFAFEKTRKADPVKIRRVLDKVPQLKMVTTHLGAWDDWAEVEKHLLGRRIYMEISFSLEYLDRAAARRFILGHPKGYVLFGTDSPWTDQGNTLELLQSLELGEEDERLILRENALALLASV